MLTKLKALVGAFSGHCESDRVGGGEDSRMEGHWALWLARRHVAARSAAPSVRSGD